MAFIISPSEGSVQQIQEKIKTGIQINSVINWCNSLKMRSALDNIAENGLNFASVEELFLEIHHILLDMSYIYCGISPIVRIIQSEVGLDVILVHLGYVFREMTKENKDLGSIFGKYWVSIENLLDGFFQDNFLYSGGCGDNSFVQDFPCPPP